MKKSAKVKSWIFSPHLKAKSFVARIIAGEPRIDGRTVDTVRALDICTGVLPRTHGSAIFTRGETQALAVARRY